jgi:hypothetical protein
MNDANFISWLLAATTPSIRYLTLRRMLGRPEEDAEVQAARHEMVATGPIPAILAGQTERGNWAGEHSYYTPKYVSTHWSMTLLTELAADGQDERLRRGAEFMLAATEAEARQEGHGWVCFWGNLLRYALYCGFDGDERVARLTDRVIRDATEAGWRCQWNDELPCAWGAARALWGLAALPSERRSAEVAAAIESGLAFLLETGRLVEADYPTPGKIHSIWARLNFPLFYQTDILFVLRVLGELGVLSHPGAQPALAWLAARRQANGTWRGASPYRGRTWPALADREETDRWVSLQAAIVLELQASGAC